MNEYNMTVVLVDIRSVHNVGSVFRTADSVGLDHIYLTGYTPTPNDRFGRERKDIAKTALGAQDSVSWSQDNEPLKLIQKLQSEGVKCVAVEQDPRSISYKELKVKKPIAFIFGNEVDGLHKDILDIVDEIIEIPQRGEKESLNISVAVGVVLYGVL